MHAESFAVALAVGPQPQEIERLQDLVDALVAHEPGPIELILVDDSPEPRNLQSKLKRPDRVHVTSAHHPRHGHVIVYKRGKGICSAILLCLQIAARQTTAGFVLKLDTDSLVIGPVKQRIEAFFAGHPKVGTIGAHTLTPNGTPRDFAKNGANIASRETVPPFDWSHPIASWKARHNEGAAKVRDHITLARKHGYEYGEHCLGGGYAIRRECLDAMNTAGFLDDPSLWLSIDCPEDVMAGMYTRAAAFELANYCGEGEVFGVRHMGLAYPPDELVRKNYGVIHAVKNDPNTSEADIRGFFKARR